MRSFARCILPLILGSCVVSSAWAQPLPTEDHRKGHPEQQVKRLPPGHHEGDGHDHGDVRPLAKPNAIIDSAFIGHSPSDMLKILRGRRRGAFATNIKLKVAIADLVLEAANTLTGTTKGKVYVIMLDSRTEPSPYAELFQPLGLGNDDVLIAANGRQWEIRAPRFPGRQLNLLEHHARGLGRFAPSRRLVIVCDTIRAWWNVEKMAKTGEAGTPVVGASATAAAPVNQLWAFALGAVLGGVLVLGGAWIGKKVL